MARRVVPAFLLTAVALAQGTSATLASSSPVPVYISIGTVRTDARQAALVYAFDYLVDMLGDMPHGFQHHKSAYLRWKPTLELHAAEGNALSRIIGQVQGVYCMFEKTSGSVQTPKSEAMLHDLLFSGGVEATSALDALAGVAEVGYVPWFPKPLRWLKTGVYVQGGYRVQIADPDTTGGRAAPEEGAVLRARARARFDRRLLGNERGVGVGLDSEAWWDFLDSRFHYSVRGALRFFFAGNKSVDITYERNSGAPAFEEGNQFGVGLTFQLAD